MVPAARSGRQNIVEGSRASATSSQTELRLVNVSRASLDEVLLDYEDYLRQRHLPQWSPDSPEALAVRAVPTVFRQAQSGRAARAERKNRSDPTDQSDHFPRPGCCPPGGLRSAGRGCLGHGPLLFLPCMLCDSFRRCFWR